MWGTWVVSIGVLNNYGRAFVAAIAQDIEAFYELRYDFVVAIILISPKSGTINKKWEGGFIHGLSTSYSHLLQWRIYSRRGPAIQNTDGEI